MDFFQHFGPNQFVALVLGSAVVYLGKTVGVRIAQHLVRLNDNLESVGTTISKTDIMWQKTADPGMWNELERRQKTATKAAKA